MSNWWRTIEDVYTNGYPSMVALLHGYDRPEFYYALFIVIIFCFFVKKIGDWARSKKWAIYTSKWGTENIIPVIFSSLNFNQYFWLTTTSLTKIIIDRENIYFYWVFWRIFGKLGMKKRSLKKINNVDIATENNYVSWVLKNTILIDFTDEGISLYFMVANEKLAQDVLQLFSDKKIPLSEAAKTLLSKKV